jgi:hypothetical protein
MYIEYIFSGQTDYHDYKNITANVPMKGEKGYKKLFC